MAGVTAVGQVMDSLAETFDFAGSRTYPWAFFGKIDSIEDDGAFNVISGYIYDPDTDTAVPTLTACMPFCHAVVGDVVFVLVSNGQAVALDRKYGLTYTLSQSGTDIILTGSDGSSQSVVANDLTQMTGILPIANGGTGSSTLADFVVEYGTSDIWTYRKWDSGMSECWGSISKNVTSWSAWGGIYEGNQMFQASYPSGLFLDTPELFAAPFGALGLAGVEFYQGASNTQTPQMYLLRGNGISGTYACKVNCYAIGRWK